MLEHEAQGVGISLAHWPVMIVQNASTDGDAFGDAAMEAQMACLRRIYAERKTAYANVIDARKGSPPTAKQRAMLSTFRAEVQAHVAEHCRGVAFVFDSVVMRGIMTAMFWVRGPDTPHAVFASIEDAISWSRERVFSAGKKAR